MTMWRLPLVVLLGCGRVDFATHLTYRDAVLEDRPSGYWRLADLGTVAHDETGHVDGTYDGACQHGVAGALAADPDPAVQLDGVTCTVVFGDEFAFAATSPFSLEVWVAVTDLGYVVTKETRTPVDPIDGYSIVFEGPSPVVYGERVVDQVITKTAAIAIAVPSAFMHFVHVYDGATQTFYIDGAQVSSTSDAGALRAYSASLQLGGLPTRPHLGGVMDEFAIYDHALSAARVTLHHDIGVNGPR